MALTCLILISSFAASSAVTVQAGPNLPWSITLHATVTTNPYWGPYGGYHDIWYAIKAEFAKIGINLEINFYDDFTWWDKVWSVGWDKTWEEGGWDLTCLEWWMMPTGLIWLEPLVYSWMIPPMGCNIFPYMNTESDKLLWRGMHNSDASDRKHYLWKWQEELMRNPPMINLYYPRLNEVVPDWIEGWDPVVRFRDVSHLAINISAMPPERKSLDSDQIHYAVSEPVWGLNPLFVETSTEQWMYDLQFETLYDLSVDPWPPTGQEPQPWEYYSKPALAAAPPFFMDGPNGPNT